MSMSIAHELKLKYGLDVEPVQELIDKWHERVDVHTNLYDKQPEEAGHISAKEVFSDYQECIYKSQSQSVMVLMQQVGELLKK
ncbi:MAG: hypothetical protein ACI9CD_001206 [Candidatus Deianiraeaceae bacterium]|jgi:hypothetical protein